MAIHAAVHYDARAVGITISKAQAELARQRVEEAGVADRVEIRLQDYRDLAGETFDAISSVGMSEHVGHGKLDQYFDDASRRRSARRDVSSTTPSRRSADRRSARSSFVGRYVFPDGELIDVGEIVLAMERAGFEVRDVESLREHYARTLRCLGVEPRVELGRGGASWSASRGPRSGGCTWPARPSDSKTGASRSTRFSASSPRTAATRRCRPLVATGAERAVRTAAG